jgi:hypothetical protein
MESGAHMRMGLSTVEGDRWCTVSSGRGVGLEPG